MSHSSDLRTRSSVISSHHLPTISRSLAYTSTTFPFHPASISHPQHSESSCPSIHRPSHPPPKVYYEEYDPRIGSAAMPPPCSEYAPFYSGRADTFEDFLDEFEGRAYDCELTDPQRVDMIIRYVDPSIHELCRSLTGYRPRNWPLFRQSLLDTFGTTTPRPQVMRQKLQNYVQGSSEKRMECVDDVLRFYRQFLCYSAPLVHTGHLTEEDRDAAFRRGFHPEDCKVLWPRLIGKNPLQPHGIPFHFEDVLRCARGAFAYDGYFPSQSPEYQSKVQSVRREQPVAEHVPRRTCGSREVSHTIISNSEMESMHSNSEPSSPSTPEPQLPASSSLSASEFQHSHTHSAMVDQPGHAFMPSIPLSTLLPSISPVPSTLSVRLTHSAAEDDLEHAPTFSTSSSTLLPSTSSVPSPSLAPSVADDDPEHASTFMDSFTPLLSISPTPSMTLSLAQTAAKDVPEIASTPSPILPILSNFEFLPSETEEEPESEPASVSSTTATSLPLPSTPSLSSPSDADVPEVASAPPSLLSILSDPECLPSETEHQPEPESASMFRIPSKFDLPPRVLSPIPDHFSASSPLLSTPDILLLSEISTPNTLPASSLHTRSSTSSEPISQPSKPCEFGSAPLSAVDVALSRSPEPSPSSLSEVILHTPDANPRTRAPILPFGATLFDSDPRAFEMTLARASSTVPSNVQPVSPPIKISLNVFISPHSSPQQSLGVTPDGSVTSPLETAPAPASPSIPSVPKQVPTAQWLLYLVPQLLQEPSLVYEASSTPASRFSHYSPPLRMSGSHSTHFDFALIIVTTAVLVFVFPNVLATFLSHACKFGNKNKDLSDRQNSNLKTGNTFAQRLRLQYTQHGKRFVFDPGGLASSLALESHENARGRKSKTRGGFVTTHDATLPTLVLVGNRTVFIAETLKFFSRRSLTGDGQDLNPLGGVRPALGLGLKRASRCHIGVTPFPGVPCILPYLF